MKRRRRPIAVVNRQYRRDIGVEDIVIRSIGCGDSSSSSTMIGIYYNGNNNHNYNGT